MNKNIRCSWCNIDNPLYIDYHDNEWGVPNFNDEYLFEMLILEIFQAGLSWETILKEKILDMHLMIFLQKRFLVTMKIRFKH